MARRHLDELLAQSDCFTTGCHPHLPSNSRPRKHEGDGLKEEQNP